MDYTSGGSPYVLLAAGVAAGALSGLAFARSLREQGRVWLKSPDRDPAAMKGPELWLPFVGMAGGAGFFLAATLQCFAFPIALSYKLSLPVAVGGALTVWWQFGIILRQIQRGGVGAIDLNSLR
ncbi:MAG: hypothetical protein BJG00_000525 [Limnothrix sp. CACIAM 69d]|nr:MAG: hypothetical protein BJG00_000525 [Limnothrix sp. CACIAM 69d]